MYSLILFIASTATQVIVKQYDSRQYQICWTNEGDNDVSIKIASVSNTTIFLLCLVKPCYKIPVEHGFIWLFVSWSKASHLMQSLRQTTRAAITRENPTHTFNNARLNANDLFDFYFPGLYVVCGFTQKSSCLSVAWWKIVLRQAKSISRTVM